MQPAPIGNARDIKNHPLKTPKREYFLTKFKVKGDAEEFIATYEIPCKGTESKKIEFSCKDKPNPSLFDALENLLEDVIEICGLNSDIWYAEGRITGITFKYADEGYNALITTQCEIGDFNFVVNTPLFYPQKDVKERLDSAIAEIEDYISGKRSQLSLF